MADDNKSPTAEELAKAQKELQEQSQKTLKILQEEVNQRKAKLEYLREEKKIASELYRINKIDVNQQEAEILQKQIDLSNELFTIRKRIAEKNYEHGGELARLMERQNELEERNVEISQEKGKEIEKNIKSLLEQNRLLQLQQEAVEQVEQSTKNFIALTTGVSDAWRGGIFGAFSKGAEAKNLGEVMSKMKDTFNETITPSNVLGSTFDKMWQSSLVLGNAMDQQQAQFVRNTGLTRETIVETQKLALENRFLGMNMENSQEAMSALTKKFSNFNDISSASQDTMVRSVALLTNLGVSAETSAAIYGDLNKVYGMSVQETEKLTRQLVALSGPGMTAGEIVEGFADSLSVLARYSGPQAIRTYKELVSQSKALQISTQNLINIASQFDTFEGAATSVGKLNALLGGDYLNSVEMLGATEAERIKMMNEAIHASGKQWDTMNKFEKMAIANAAGISDMNEASKLFGTSMVEMERRMLQDRGREKTQEQFNKMMESMQTLSDDLISIGQSFAVVFTPLIGWLKDATSWYGKLDSRTREITGSFIGLGGAIGAVALAWKSLSTAVNVFRVAGDLPEVSKNLKNMTKNASDFSKTAPKAAGGLNNIKGASKGGGAAGLGLVKLSIGLLAAGGAALMFGYGVKLAAEGMSTFVDSFGALTPEHVQGLTMFLGAVGGLALISPAVALLAASMGTLGTSILIFAEGVKRMPNLNEFVNLLREINNLEDIKIELFQKVNRSIIETVDAIDSKPGAAQVLSGYSKAMASTSTEGNTSAGKEHVIILKQEDSAGNLREIKRIAVAAVRDELEFRNV